MNAKIAICITTRNRPEAFATTYLHIQEYLPEGAALFIVDDASDITYCDSDYRFCERVGIPRAKNKCFELAYDWGADHIFLFDDDCYPKMEGWHLPYIQSGVNHLCFTFTSGWEGTSSWNSGYVNDGFMIHQLGCGCMMYFTRKCLNIVGGFDTEFGLGKYEHTDLSRRIHNAGLTPHRFMDVIDSDKLFHSMDQYGQVKRTFNEVERKKLMASGESYFYANQHSSKYISFNQ